MNATRVSVAAAIILLTTAAVGRTAEGPAGASSCTGCHAAASGSSAMPALGGLAQADIAEKMIAFKSGKLSATIMDRIAKGFSDDEIRAIAAWYAAQKP
jgi:cytochrome subunit of sulfide dehydrogenase